MASIFGRITVLNRLPRAKKVGGIIIDGLLEEVHIGKSKITRLPVEDGSTISDHITNDPVTVTIKGVITNTPLFYQTFLDIFQGGNVFGDRVTQAFEALQQLQTEKKLISVVTCLKLYHNMAIESLTQVKNQTTGQSMEITMTLVHIEKVKNQVVRLPDSILGGDIEEQLLAQSNVALGQTVGTTPPNIFTILADMAAQLGGGL